MALVDFKKIPLYEILYSDTEPPVFIKDIESGEGAGGSGILYNELWGYFTFEQQIKFDYKNTNEHYISNGVFVINGVFTVNAEYPPAPGNLDHNVPPHPEDPVTGHDEQRFRTLQAKYDALRDVFAEAARGTAPENLSDYATVNDDRCVPLPYPLRDKDNQPVYARPTSFRIEETQWPNLIKYSATLEEPIVPACKVTLDDILIDKGVITITVKRPRLKMQYYSFASSAEAYFSGWNSQEYNVTGYLHEVPPSGHMSTERMTAMINNLMDGRVNIGKQSFDGMQSDVMFPDLFTDSADVSVTPVNKEQGVKISLTAKE